MKTRAVTRKALSPRIDIVAYAPELAGAFRDLNIEWLQKYFDVEAIDAEILGDPERHIIAHGGYILFACLDGRPVGTVALKAHADGVFELTKMAVTGECQGKGIGRRLLRAALDRYRQTGARTLFLESHSSLGPALHLYLAEGFRHVPRPQPSPYRRSDVYMQYFAPESDPPMPPGSL